MVATEKTSNYYMAKKITEKGFSFYSNVNVMYYNYKRNLNLAVQGSNQSTVPTSSAFTYEVMDYLASTRKKLD